MDAGVWLHFGFWKHVLQDLEGSCVIYRQKNHTEGRYLKSSDGISYI